MRFTLLAGSSRLSPRSSAMVSSLLEAGHETSVSRVARSRFRGERLMAVPHPSVPGGRGRPAHPEVVWPDTSGLIATADRLSEKIGAWVARRPDWPAPRRDHMAVVPSSPELSVPVGQPVPELAPWSAHGGQTPAGRHTGRQVVLVFRSTPSSPGHYLRRAMERAGIEVHVTDRVDLGDHPDAAAVVIVESPTPAIEITGSSAVPVIFWVHHGEHHLEGNLRLARRYGADLVLLAHSWHLAARFSCRVERFPFAVAPELVPAEAGVDFAERPVDLAFVGSVGGFAYGRRQELIDQATAALDRVEVANGITPVAMSALYGRSRAVLNDGGTRHRPITMRAFEATGAGALLVSEESPGMELLFGGLYIPLGDAGVEGADLRAVLADPASAALAAAAHERAMQLHTYDHRVDLLLRLAATVEKGNRERSTSPVDSIGAFLYQHPYGQRILDATGEVAADDREVWRVSELGADPGPRSFDTVVMNRSSPPTLAVCARRYVIGRDIVVSELPMIPRRVGMFGDLTVVDAGGDGYDVETVGGPGADAESTAERTRQRRTHNAKRITPGNRKPRSASCVRRSAERGGVSCRSSH